MGRETWKRLGSWGAGTGSWGAGGASWKRVEYQQLTLGSWGVELGSRVRSWGAGRLVAGDGELGEAGS